MIEKIKIAILTTEDLVWEYQCWQKALTDLKRDKRFEIKGLWGASDKLSQYHGDEIASYYARVFGAWSCFKLKIFAILVRLKQIFSGQWGGFYGLCKRHDIPFLRIDNPNDKIFGDWLRVHEIDCLIIMTPHILKPFVLQAVKGPVINMHTSLLPKNRGLFPYFWAVINGDRQGVSFHKVDEGIDTGDIIYQKEIKNTQALRSMTAFHHYIYREVFTQGLMVALNEIDKNSDKTLNNLSDGYQNYKGLLTQNDMKLFFEKNGKVIDFKDFFFL